MSTLCLPGGAGETGRVTPSHRLEFLHPGRLVVSPSPARVTTILGSCVAVCLWDGACGAGGVNHFVLPFGPESDPAPLRFGGPATRELVLRLLALGARQRSLRAKVFGGASLGAFSGSAATLGFRNVARALEVLEEEGIPVVACDTEGTHGRKLVFHTEDGTAWVRSL